MAVWFPCKQGDEAWVKHRLGRITGSRLGEVMTKGRAGEEFGKVAHSYALEILCEMLTGRPQDSLNTREMEWGNTYEPDARLAYCLKNGIRIDQVGFAVLDDLEIVGASVDGLVGQDGIIEIKCPFNSRNHLQNLRHRKVPTEYVAQVQGGLWILDRKWCDFISYDPRMPEVFMLGVVRIERDDEFIEQLSHRCRLFAKLIDELKSSILAAQGASDATKV